MTPVAIIFLSLSIVLVWGGCLTSVLFLRKRPELAASEYPAGGEDDERDESEIVRHDT